MNDKERAEFDDLRDRVLSLEGHVRAQDRMMADFAAAIDCVLDPEATPRARETQIHILANVMRVLRGQTNEARKEG